ncbi:MAG: XdhC family protein [Thermoplasmata archaeon]|uniref:XdhC family protein n=1 Tax=Candidatus Sysuiplasma superficiale TaxID=2823368 RepID=A0A8J7YQ75_9ARCH|nr:XdhC family protein [Candidatus Sysuiplasma superficiale]MBX8644475.1 XdhC family protein [Candidatus Sysuiplasma superficiale]MCL4346850.1 XdhC family protein [Candidatus Thermoplasmatota archaeon]
MKNLDFIRKMNELTQEGVPFAVATVVRIEGSSLGKPGFKAIVSGENVLFGSLGGVCPEAVIVTTAEDAIKSNKPKLVRIHLEEAGKAIEGMARAESEDDIYVETFCGGMMEVYVEPFRPAERLVIIGQGGKDDVEDALVRLGRLLDFEVLVIDRTPVLSEKPDAILKDVKDDLSNFESRESDYVVLLTKGAYDIPALKGLSERNVRYIGMLASRKRIKEDFEQLRSLGVGENFLERIHSPIGLDIGAVSPEEIALSIAAEIVSVRRNRGRPQK